MNFIQLLKSVISKKNDEIRELKEELKNGEEIIEEMSKQIEDVKYSL